MLGPELHKVDGNGGGSVLEQQVLFDVYVHPHPSFPGDVP